MILAIATLAGLVVSAPGTPTDPQPGPKGPGPSASTGAPRDHLQEANAAASKGDWKAVIEVCSAWQRTAASDPTPPLCLAQALKSAGRFVEAADAARRSIALQDGAVARFYLGVALYEMGELEAARAELVRSVALQPGDANSRRMLGNASAALGRYSEALAEAKAERAASPQNYYIDERVAYRSTAAAWAFPPEALRLHGRGGWLAEHGRFEEAVGVYRQALALAPGFADCHYQLGWALHRLGNTEAAEEEYRQAIATYSSEERRLRGDALFELGELVRRRGAARDAVPLLKEAIRVAGDHFLYLYALGRACHDVKDRACAVEAFSKLLASPGQVPPQLLADARKALAELGEARPGVAK